MKESNIVTAISTYLQMLENQGKLIFIRNNSGAYKMGNSFVRFGKAGSPDFFMFLDEGENGIYGRTLHIEVKNEKGKQNDNQKEYQKNIEALGHRYIIVRSLEEVENLLTK